MVSQIPAGLIKSLYIRWDAAEALVLSDCCEEIGFIETAACLRAYAQTLRRDVPNPTARTRAFSLIRGLADMIGHHPEGEANAPTTPYMGLGYTPAQWFEFRT